MPKPPSPPSSQPTSSAAGGAGASSSSWKLHPSVPVDVRLLGAGAVGAGALLYSLSGGGGGDADNQQDKKKINEETAQEERVFVIEDESTSGTEAEQKQESKEEIEGSLSKEENISSPPSEDQTANAAIQAEEKTKEEEEEPAIVVDSNEVLKMIEDVLSKPAEQMLSEDEAALQSARTIRKEEKAERQAERKEEDIQAAQVAITTAISDSAAESVSSGIAKAPKGVDAMTPSSSSSSSHKHVDHHHHSGITKKVSPSSPSPVSDSLASAAATLAGVDPEILNILGLHADMTAAALLAAATKSGSGPGDNWEEYAYRHKQATSDAEVLGVLLDSAAQHVKKQLSAAQAAALAGHEEAEQAKKAAAAQTERFRSALTEALKRAEEGHIVQMNQQAEKLANAHAEMTVRERVERQKIIDELRKKLGALERALEKRADAARGSTAAHRVAQGAFALQETLEKGGKVDNAVEYLTEACGGDPLVRAAVRALPRGKSILSPVQLADEFTAVEKAAKELSLLPAGHGGMLSAAVAKLVSKLKLKEKNPQILNESYPSGIDGKLGEIESEVVHGRYTQAARKLEEAVQGTAAAVAVKDWVEAARARAAAEQAVAVVEAHAATAALSLA